MRDWHDYFRRLYRCRVKYRSVDLKGEFGPFFRSIILYFLYLIILIIENNKIRKKLQALRFAVESGDGAAPGAFVSDVSRDHLGALPATRRHKGWELLPRPCQVSRHANARAVTAVSSYLTGGQSRCSDASANSLGMKAEHELVLCAIGPDYIKVAHCLTADEKQRAFAFLVGLRYTYEKPTCAIGIGSNVVPSDFRGFAASKQAVPHESDQGNV